MEFNAFRSIPLAGAISGAGDDSREEGRSSVAGCRPIARGCPRWPNAAGNSGGAVATKGASDGKAATHPPVSAEDRPHKTSLVADDAVQSVYLNTIKVHYNILWLLPLYDSP
jgi:hypothetical protein